MTIWIASNCGRRRIDKSFSSRQFPRFVARKNDRQARFPLGEAPLGDCLEISHSARSVELPAEWRFGDALPSCGGLLQITGAGSSPSVLEALSFRYLGAR
jgi:hypothetical protein